MMYLILSCGECDRKLEGDLCQAELIEKALKFGWKVEGNYNHICPWCIAANATDAELAQYRLLMAPPKEVSCTFLP